MTVQLVFAAIFALAYLAMVSIAPNWPRTAVKTLSVLLLATAAVPHAPVLALALFLCAVGDFFLSRVGDRAFLSGLIAFAAGHLVYVIVFLRVTPSGDWHWFLALVALAMIGAAGAAMRLILPHTNDLKPATTAYLGIILAMGLTATLTRDVTLIVAAILFMTSDFLLGFQKFVWTDGRSGPKLIPYAVWSFYWLAQAWFLVGIIRIG